MVGPGRAGVDPGAQDGNLGGGQRGFVGGRHPQLGVGAADVAEEGAAGGVARQEIRGGALAPGERDGLHIDAVTALLFFGSVAFQAMGSEQRLDFALEVRGRTRGDEAEQRRTQPTQTAREKTGGGNGAGQHGRRVRTVPAGARRRQPFPVVRSR